MRLEWDRPERIDYQLGVDRGVLYPEGSAGVAWNGLITVTEDSVGGDRSEYYHGGDKYAEDVSLSIYQGNIKAFSAPEEFLACIGEIDLVPGVRLTGQPKKRFGLSYRTLIGNGGYKINLVYNATARPSSRTLKTMGGRSSDPTPFEWQLDAVPPVVGPFVPTAHFVIDSTNATSTKLTVLENLLYGNASTAPQLPDITTLLSIFQT